MLLHFKPDYVESDCRRKSAKFRTFAPQWNLEELERNVLSECYEFGQRSNLLYAFDGRLSAVYIGRQVLRAKK